MKEFKRPAVLSSRVALGGRGLGPQAAATAVFFHRAAEAGRQRHVALLGATSG